MKKLLLTGLILGTVLTSCKSKETTPEASAASEAAVPTGDTSENALDWAGTYRAVMPCADCEGIMTEIILNDDRTYKMSMQYQGKSDSIYVREGSFTWNENGTNISLSGMNEDEAFHQFMVGENALFKLDKDGNRITGDLAANYRLTKDMGQITDKYWKLIELNGQPVTASESTRKEAHIMFSTEDNRVYGNGGCNSFNGTYEMPGMNRIRFSKMASTLMACPNMEAEDQFIKVLEMVDNYTVNGDNLSLNKAKMAPLARFEAVYFK